MAELLPALDAAFPTDLLSVVRGFLAATAGATTVDILMADYDLLVLRPAPGGHDRRGYRGAAVDDSPAGRAFINQDTITEATDDAVNVYLPISVRAERLGVLDIVLREPPDADALDTLSQLVIVLGYLLPAAHNDTDIVERARERPLELPAEMQWSMLPIRAYSCDQFGSAWPVSWSRRTKSAATRSTMRSARKSCSSR